MELRGQLIPLPVVFESCHRREGPGRVRKDDRLRPRFFRERDNNSAALFVGNEAAAIQPDGGVLHRLVRLVENRDHVAGGPDVLQERPLTLANEGATGLAAADELDYP